MALQTSLRFSAAEALACHTMLLPRYLGKFSWCLMINECLIAKVVPENNELVPNNHGLVPNNVEKVPNNDKLVTNCHEQVLTDKTNA